MPKPSDDTRDLFTVNDAKGPWFVVTNHLNLYYMLSAGMLFAPEARGDKYYLDTLGDCEGWIPLFRKSVPEQAIQRVLSENAQLRLVVLEIALEGFKGTVQIFRNGQLEEGLFPDRIWRDDQLILVPAPLPASSITSIRFESGEDKKLVGQRATGYYDNVPWTAFKQRAKAGERWMPPRDSASAWPLDCAVPRRDVPVDRSLVHGGMAAMLFQVGNRGDRASSIARNSVSKPFDAKAKALENVVDVAGQWLLDSSQSIDPPEILHLPKTPSTIEHVHSTLFRDIIGQLSQLRMRSTESPLDVVLEYLARTAEQFPDWLKDNTLGLHNSLKQLKTFGAEGPRELTKQYQRPFSRALVLFFALETCEDLLEYRQSKLKEEDWIVAASLFGARDTWIGLSASMRDIPGLGEHIMVKMADMGLSIGGGKAGLFGMSDSPFASVREKFKSLDRSKRENVEAALTMARTLKWTDCARTVVTIGHGDYQLEVSRSGVKICFPGEPRAFRTEVQWDRFYACLGGAPVNRKLYQLACKVLGEYSSP